MIPRPGGDAVEPESSGGTLGFGTVKDGLDRVSIGPRRGPCTDASG